MTSFKKSALWSVLALFLGFNVHAGVGSIAARMADFLVTGTGLTEALAKNGVRGVEANYVRTSVLRSLDAFRLRQGDSSSLIRTLRDLPLTGEDAVMRDRMLRTLTTSSAKVSEGDFVEAINSLIFLSHRYGFKSSTMLTCSECVSRNLARKGFQFTLKEIKSEGMESVIKRVPREAEDVVDFISMRMRKFGYEDFSLLSTTDLKASDERAFALYLAAKEYGSGAHKSLVTAIENLSRNSKGEVRLFDSSNFHRLWKVFSTDLPSDKVANLTKLFVDAQKVRGNKTAEEAVLEVLAKTSKGDAYKEKRLSFIKRNNCFFKR